MYITPAILENNIDDYAEKIKLVESLPGNNKVHYDIMDGIFVATKSPDLEAILQFETNLEKQVHLMVQHPEEYFDLCLDKGVNEVIFHYESNFSNYDSLINYPEIDFVLAVNPETNIHDIYEELEHFSGVLIMTVNPGKQGGDFIPEELPNVTYLQNNGYEGKILVDGSINDKTIELAKQHKIHELIVGSAIVKQSDPGKKYLDLLDLIK